MAAGVLAMSNYAAALARQVNNQLRGSFFEQSFGSRSVGEISLGAAHSRGLRTGLAQQLAHARANEALAACDKCAGCGQVGHDDCKMARGWSSVHGRGDSASAVAPARKPDALHRT